VRRSAPERVGLRGRRRSTRGHAMVGTSPFAAAAGLTGRTSGSGGDAMYPQG
jgi:hypothetical protein